MLKLKLQYFGQLMWRTDSLEKTLMLGKIEGKRRWEQLEDKMVGWHHQLNGHEFEQAPGVGDGQGSHRAAVHGVSKNWTWQSDWTELKSLRFQIDSCYCHRKAFIVSVHRIVFSSLDCDGSDFFFVPFWWAGIRGPGKAVVVSAVYLCALWRCWRTQFLNAMVEDAVSLMVKPGRQAMLGWELALVSMGFLRVARKWENCSFWGSWAAKRNVSLAEYVLGM